MLWSLLRQDPIVPIPSTLMTTLWLTDAMGLDIIRQPPKGSTPPPWLLSPAEVVELLASHAGSEFASKGHWLSAPILSPDAIGCTVGACYEGIEGLLSESLSQDEVTTVNQVELWRDVVYHYLVERRRMVLDAIRQGFQGSGPTPHPLMMQLRLFSFGELREIVSGRDPRLDTPPYRHATRHTATPPRNSSSPPNSH